MFVDKPEQVSLQKAEVAFARKTSGALEPYRFLGIAPKVEFSAMGDDTEDITDPRQVTGSPYRRLRRKRVPEFGLTLKAINPDNLALVYAGAVSEYVQTNAAVQDEALVGGVAVGAIYKLGAFAIDSLDELATIGDVAFTVDDDYVLDADTGIIEVTHLPAGATAGDLLKCSYTPTAILTGAGLKQVKAATVSRIEGRLLLRGLSGDGEKRLVEIWNVDVAMDGALAFVTESSAEVGLKVTVLTDPAHTDLWRDLQMAAPVAT